MVNKAIITDGSQWFEILNLYDGTWHSEIREAMYYNVTMRRVRLTTVGMEKHYALHILSFYLCLNYPTCKAHAVYYAVICDLSVSTTFFHIISYTRFSEKIY